MGIRQLPSGSFQVRFQVDHVPYAATYPTREVAQEAELLTRAAALAPRTPPISPTTTWKAGDDADPSPAWRPSPAEVTASSAQAAATIDAVFADFDIFEVTGESTDELLTTGQAAALIGVSRPTLVAWLEAGRIPYQRRDSHRRVLRSAVQTYRILRPS